MAKEIHSFCIMHTTGVPIYQKHFTKEFMDLDFTMITSLFSALIQFAQKVTKNSLDVLDMGEYRLMLHPFKDSILNVIITKTTTSVLLIKDRISKIEREIENLVDVEAHCLSCEV